MRALLLLLLSCLGCFAQAFSFADPTVGGWGGIPTSGAVDYSVPPTNTFVRGASNPMSGSRSVLSENIVQDTNTGLYLMLTTEATATKGLGVWTNGVDPKLPSGWVYASNLVDQASGSPSPHLLQGTNGYWYLFYGNAGDTNILVSSNTSPFGPFTNPAVALALGAGGAFDDSRVIEPYVLQRADGVWAMLYMGDAGSTTEQIGYATASSPGGPWTKYSGNPVLAFGSAGTYDAGTVADPWCIYWNGTYYIGYASGYTTSAPWQTALATTTDWTNFTKVGILLGTNSVASWGDETNSFRGAVTQIGREWVLPYTGDTYKIGIATSPSDSNIPNIGTTTAKSLDAFSVILSFDTDVNSKCGAIYGTSSGTYTLTNFESTASNFSHIVTLTGLTSSATAYYKTLATNILSTTSTSTNEGSFTLSAGGLIGQWTLTDGSGTTVADSTTNAHTGNFTNTPVWQSPHGLYFNGTDNFVNFGNILNPGYSNFSYSFWFSYTNPSTAKNYGFFGKTVAGGNPGRYGVYASSGQIIAIVQPGGTAYSTLAFNDQSYTNGVYHLMCVTVDRTGNELCWVDGIARGVVAVASGSSSNMNSSALVLAGVYGNATGTGPNAGWYFPGFLDDIRFFNRLLTTNEIQTIYANGRE